MRREREARWAENQEVTAAKAHTDMFDRGDMTRAREEAAAAAAAGTSLAASELGRWPRVPGRRPTPGPRAVQPRQPLGPPSFSVHTTPTHPQLIILH